MELDKDKLRDLLLWLFNGVEKIEKELLAYKVAFLFLNATGQIVDLQQILDLARKNSAAALDRKYTELRELIPKILDQANADQDLDKLIRQWKPTGPPN